MLRFNIDIVHKFQFYFPLLLYDTGPPMGLQDNPLDTSPLKGNKILASSLDPRTQN